MSRSRKKHPFYGNCGGGGGSDKYDKIKYHRRWRRSTKVRILKGEDPKSYKAFSDPWTWNKDGKSRVGDEEVKTLWAKKIIRK